MERRDALEKGLETKVLVTRQEKIRNWKPVPAEKTVPKKEFEKTKIPTIPGYNDPQTLQDFLASEGFLFRDGRPFVVTLKMVDEAIAKQDVDDLTKAIEAAGRHGQKKAYGYYADLFKTRLNNIEEAFLWYKKGAEAGDVYAQYQVAKMYCEGKGIPQPDAVACYAWLKMVQEEQNPVLNSLVQNALSVVEKSATPEELASGEEMLKNLRKSPEEKQEEKSSMLNFF